MGLYRPGTRIRFWSPGGIRNKPDVEPPILLRLAGVLSLFSVIGVFVYAVAVGIRTGSVTEIISIDAIYVAVLHFLLPFGVFYMVSINSYFSRPILTIYFTAMYVATLGGIGYLGELPFTSAQKAAVATPLLLIALYWLFGSARMRVFYALLRDRPVPVDLQDRLDEFAGRHWPSERVRQRLEWLADHLETVVLVGLIVGVVFAYLHAYG